MAFLAVMLLLGGFVLWLNPGQSRNKSQLASKKPGSEDAVAAANGAREPATDDADGMMSGPSMGGPSMAGSSMSGPAMGGSHDDAATSASVHPTDHDLNKIVSNESHDYGRGTEKPESLKPVVVEQRERRSPAEVAARIDEIINSKLAAEKITTAPPSDDAEFLRRATLDLIGVIPAPARVRSFLAETSSGKRAKLIDELLDDPRYGDHFAHVWHDLLVKRDPDNNKNLQSHPVFLKWLAHQFNINRPWSQTVRSMLTAAGDETIAGETFFIRANTDNNQPSPQKIVGTAAALFLGNQLMCAECHVHPVNAEWSQQDFWGLAAFFAETRAKYTGDAKTKQMRLARIVDESGGSGGKGDKASKKGAGGLKDSGIPIPDPRNDGKFIGVAQPRLIGYERKIKRNDVTRTTIADWFTADENPYFPRATINRLWATFFARGLINPLDDMRPENHASHPEIVDLLAEEAIVSHHDLKHLTRCICLSNAYQRSSRTTTNSSDHEAHFSHMALKVLPPRALFLSLQAATGGRVSVPADTDPGRGNQDDTGKGMTFFDIRDYDAPLGEYAYGVPQLLRLMNGTLPEACDAAAKDLVRSGGRESVIDKMYLASLSRHPTPEETRKISSFLAKERDAAKGYSAVLWALLNSAEFYNNH